MIHARFLLATLAASNLEPNDAKFSQRLGVNLGNSVASVARDGKVHEILAAARRSREHQSRFTINRDRPLPCRRTIDNSLEAAHSD